jgi:hypothetical protein
MDAYAELRLEQLAQLLRNQRLHFEVFAQVFRLHADIW